ncbi:MAG: hydantoinase/carbamoylase family amidase [Terracidiphilus sp.]|nr:hydantoinase/carbamoylase family amidase [Terracidiphilus sp.]
MSAMEWPLPPRPFDPATAAEIFAKLRAISYDGVGITRESYGESEQAAFDLVRSIAEAHGLRCETDAAANFSVILDGAAAEPSVLCGSHLDSVPHGGNFDGAAGVVAGLLCLCAMKNAGLVPHRTIRLIAFRGEESAWYGKACLGSHALFGQLSRQDFDLQNLHSGETLSNAMARRGADVELLRRALPLIAPVQVAAYFELHIEQGPVLVNLRQPFGIVSGIRGTLRHKSIVCRGEDGHSGTVPMGMRHDAAMAVADLLTRLERQWKRILREGRDLVFTTGMVHTDSAENAITRIPAEVVFSVDIRSLNEETLDIFYRSMLEEQSAVEAARGVSFCLDRHCGSEPVRLDAHWIERLQALGRALGHDAPVLPSGASHDAVQFALAGIPTAMIFVRNENGSHNPREAMEIDDFILAAELLYQALLEAA